MIAGDLDSTERVPSRFWGGDGLRGDRMWVRGLSTRDGRAFEVVTQIHDSTNQTPIIDNFFFVYIPVSFPGREQMGKGHTRAEPHPTLSSAVITSTVVDIGISTIY